MIDLLDMPLFEALAHIAGAVFVGVLAANGVTYIVRDIRSAIGRACASRKENNYG